MDDGDLNLVVLALYSYANDEARVEHPSGANRARQMAELLVAMGRPLGGRQPDGGVLGVPK
jgi:hypothetical protein